MIGNVNMIILHVEILQLGDKNMPPLGLMIQLPTCFQTKYVTHFLYINFGFFCF